MTLKVEKTASLPVAVRGKWKDREVVVISTSTVYIAKPITKSTQVSLLNRLKEAGKNITSKDIQRAIASARR